MEKAFYLDLPSVIASLGRRSALLRARLPQGFARLGEPCTGFVRISEGVVTSCSIQNSSGYVLLMGQAAFTTLIPWKEWYLTLETSATPAKPPPPVQPAPDSRSPRLLRAIQPQEINQYTQQDRAIIRTVLTLIDGRRTVSQLRTLLPIPAATVDDVLRVLQRMGVVELEEKQP